MKTMTCNILEYLLIAWVAGFTILVLEHRPRCKLVSFRGVKGLMLKFAIRGIALSLFSFAVLARSATAILLFGDILFIVW
jgi:hypothetical protein